MDLLGKIAEGLVLDLEPGLDELTLECGLHLLFLLYILAAPEIKIRQHHEEEDAEEKQDKEDRKNCRRYLFFCSWHNKKAPLSPA